MGFVTGIKQVQKTLEQRDSGSGDRVKANWFSPEPDTSYDLVFLQELDEDAKNYSEKNGLAKFFLEHSNPADWRKKAECTVDEGECYGCEQGWATKVTLYINALVNGGKYDNDVVVWSRGTGKGSVGKQLLEIAAEEETITDINFKLKRSGKTKDDTSYLLMPKKEHKLNVEDFELFELDKVVFKVKPENQEKYYTGDKSDDDEAKAPTSQDVDAEW